MEKTPAVERTPAQAPSEQEAEGERKAIRKAIDETEAPVRVEIKKDEQKSGVDDNPAPTRR